MPPESTMLVKPMFRWAGSKSKQVDRLAAYWSKSFSRYVEPFAGSACLFLHLNPERALIADKNSELIEAYQVIVESPDEVYRTMVRKKRAASTYYYWRSQDPECLSRFDRAVRFLYLNRNCFNGIYRTNRQGGFNVPFSANRVGRYLTKKEFMETVERLSKAEFRAWDFGTTMRYVREGDFVYLDPPYMVDSRRVFNEYGKNPFTKDDLIRLRNHLQRIDEKGASFLVSYADCKEARELAVGWKIRRMRVRRHVAGFSDARRSAYEVLITNIQQ